MHSSFQFDDYAFIENPLIKDLHNILRFFQKNDVSLPSRGVVTTTLAVNYRFSGESVESYHWTNTFIHLINGILVYFLTLITLHLYTSRRGRTEPNTGTHNMYVLALFVALFFVTNPIQTHTVTYICKRYESVVSFFYLLSLILFVRAAAGHKIKTYLYAGSILSFLCALWCKEIAYTVPLVMFLYYQCFVADKLWPLDKGLKLVLPYIVLAVASFYISTPLGEEKLQSGWTRWEYLLTQSNVLIEYIKTLLLPLPSRLNVDADFPLSETFWEPPTPISVVSVVAILMSAVLYLDKARLLAFYVLWFFIILAPTSSVIPLPDIMVLYRLYLPSLAFCLLLVTGIHKVFCCLAEKKEFDHKLLWQVELTVLGSIVMFYGICTYKYNMVWETEISLWEDTIKKSPNKIRPHYGLGHAYQTSRQKAKAKEEYLECLAIFLRTPNMKDWAEIKHYSRACNNLAVMYANSGLYDTAVALMREAVQADPKSVTMHYNLGCLYLHNNNREAATVELEKALQLNPQYRKAGVALNVVREGGDWSTLRDKLGGFIEP